MFGWLRGTQIKSVCSLTNSKSSPCLFWSHGFSVLTFNYYELDFTWRGISSEFCVVFCWLTPWNLHDYFSFAAKWILWFCKKVIQNTQLKALKCARVYQNKIHLLIQNSLKASGEVKQKSVHFLLISLFSNFHKPEVHARHRVFGFFSFRANIIFVIHRNSSSV